VVFLAKGCEGVGEIRTVRAPAVFPQLAVVLTALAGEPGSGRIAALAPLAPVFLGRHAGRATKSACETGLR
jgi:hypothetical protein